VILFNATPVAPVAVFVTDWIRQHLSLYARELWHRRPR